MARNTEHQGHRFEMNERYEVLFGLISPVVFLFMADTTYWRNDTIPELI